ncbi:hypothetical protein [Streptomyces sp. NPDC002845]
MSGGQRFDIIAEGPFREAGGGGTGVLGGTAALGEGRGTGGGGAGRYPRLGAFRGLADELDPVEKFRNAFVRGVLGG